MIKTFSELPLLLQQNKFSGCFLDTSVLVAATYDLDVFHEATSEAFEYLAEAQTPTFSNINVRAEFLEHQRRILIPECLCDFLEDFSTELDERLLFKLQSHRTSYRRKIENKQSVNTKSHVGCSGITFYRKHCRALHECECRNVMKRKLNNFWINASRGSTVSPNG